MCLELQSWLVIESSSKFPKSPFSRTLFLLVFKLSSLTQHIFFWLVPDPNVLQTLDQRGKFQKAPVYQKKYLLLLQGGFQKCESTTLAMISQLDVYPTNADRVYRRRGINRFRAVARAVPAVQRMNFLVNKSKRVPIAGSRESTSRSHVVNGDVSSHMVYQALASNYVPRSSSDGALAVPTLNLYQNGAIVSPRSDWRTYERHDIGVNGDLDSSSHRSFPTSSRSPRSYFPTPRSDSQATSAPRAREQTTSDYTRVVKSPPVRDSVSTQRNYGERDRFDSADPDILRRIVGKVRKNCLRRFTQWKSRPVDKSVVLSLRSRPPSKMARTSQRTQFVLVYHFLCTRKPLPHFKYDMPSEPGSHKYCTS